MTRRDKCKQCNKLLEGHDRPEDFCLCDPRVRTSKVYEVFFNKDLTDPDTTHEKIGTVTLSVDVERPGDPLTQAVLQSLVELSWKNSPHSSLQIAPAEALPMNVFVVCKHCNAQFVTGKPEADAAIVMCPACSKRTTA